MIIDVHAHVISEELLNWLVSTGTFGFARREGGGYCAAVYPELDRGLYAFDKRLSGLDQRGVDLQLVSPLPNFLSWPGGAADVDFARRVNASTADCVGRSGGRFAGLAAVALGEPDRAVDELDRALGEHGLVGAVVGTFAGDKPLDHAAFEPLFAALERKNLPVLVHPTSAEPLARWDDYGLAIGLAWPNETTLALTRLIFAGTLERHPYLRLIAAHGGGNLLFMKGRLDLTSKATGFAFEPSCRAHITQAPGVYYDRLLFDTVVGSREQLRFLIDMAGADRVVFGTDDPFEVADPVGAMAVPEISALTPAERDKILGGTIAALLPASICRNSQASARH